jgi:hypothetical protein
MGMIFPGFNLRQACCTMTLITKISSPPPVSAVNRREMMCEMSRSRRHVVDVVTNTCILERGFSDIVEEIYIQKFSAGMVF